MHHQWKLAVLASSVAVTLSAQTISPVISSVSPALVARGAPTTTFVLTGSNFTPGSQTVTFAPPGGSATGVTILPTPSPSVMSVSVPNTLLTTVGTGTFVVTTAASGASNAGTIAIVQPVITSQTPTSLSRGAVNPSLTVAGTNFTIGGSPILEFTPPGGSATNITPSSSSATSLTATIPTALLATSGNATLRVISGTAASSSVTFPITAPTITLLSPNTAVQNSATQSVVITGTGFAIGGTTATWIPPTGTPTTALSGAASSATSMTVSVPNTLLTAIGTAQIFVTAGTATSNASNFTITAAGPSISSITPGASPQNTASSFTLAGFNFTPLTSITYTPPGGSPISLTPTSTSATTIVVPLSAAQTATLGTGTFTVTTPTGSPATTAVQIYVPSISAISPASVLEGQTTQVFDLTGANLGGNGSVARFTAPGGAVTDLPLTNFRGLSNFTAAAAQLQTGGVATVSVVDGGAISNSVTIQVVEPVISVLSPTSALQNDAQFNLILTGTNFTAGGTPVVRFTPPGGSPTVLALNPTPSATSISAIVPTGLLATTGIATVTVQTGTAVSSPVNFSIGSRPTITSLSPDRVVVGSGQLSPLVITGTNFTAGGAPTAFFVTFSGTQIALANTVTSTGTSMSVTIPANFLATVGTASIMVRSGSTDSNFFPFTIAPAPSISFTSQSSDFAGAPDLLLPIFGTNFTAGGTPTVRWTNGANTTILAINGTPTNNGIDVTIPAALLVSPGSASIVVQVGGVNSAPVTFTIYPTPLITTLSPTSATAGAAGFTLTINGANLTLSGFIPVVQFNTTNITPSTFGPNALTVNIPASLIATAGVFPVTVTLNPDVMGALPASKGRPQAGRVFGEVRNVSNIVNFTVNGAAPTLTSLTPSTATAGAAAFALTIVGSGFAAGDTVDFNGTSITPSSLTSTQVVATVPALAIATPGVKNVRVLTAAGVPSNTLTFRVNYNITSLSPSFATVGGALFPLTVNATAVLSGAQIVFNGNTLTTLSSTTTSVTANVPASLITTPNVVPVTLTDGTLTSNALDFSILGALNVTSLNPPSVQAGSGQLTLQVTGSGFDSGSTVLANNSPVTTTFQSATQLTATIPSGLVLNAGAVAISVRDSNQRVSNAVDLQVLAPIAISSLNPSFANAAGNTFTLTVNGSGFANGMTVYAGATSLTSVFGSATQMTATIPAALITAPGSLSITVRDANQRTSNAVSLPILGGLTITSLSPTFREAGTAAFTLTVNGSAFDDASVVLAGAQTLTTTFVSATQLQATLPAALIATAGSLSITVRDARSRTSNAVSLPILAPLRIGSLSPNFRDAGSGTFTMTVGGSGFESNSVVNFNGTPLAIQGVVSEALLNATVPASLIASSGTASITVSDNRGRTSNSVPFNILTPLTITSLSPSFVEAGAAAFTLTLNGTGFTNGMTVRFGASSIPATVGSSNQATAQIPANLVANVGVVPVFVQSQVSNPTNESSDTRQSNTVNFQVLTPLTLTSVTPPRANAGVPTFTLVVAGQGFISGAVIRFNNANLTTTFVNSTTLTGIVTPPLVGAPGSTEVRVQLQDGRISSALPFTILPQLRITQINPPATAAGANSFTMTVTGDGFTNESIVRIGGFGLQTTFVSSTQLTAFVSDTIVANPTTADVTVANPLGAISNAISFSAGGTISVTSINPAGAPAGSNAVPIAISGTGFTAATVARFGTTDLATTFVNPTQLNALIPAALLATPGNFAISAAAGATVSNSVNFEVGGKPELNFLNPDAVTAGSRSITIIALGRGYLPGATLKFGDDDIPTTFASGTQVSGVVSAALLATARTVSVTVVNSNGAASNSKEFRIAALTLTSLTPDKATAGAAALTLAVEGSGFINGAIVSFGGRSLITTFGGVTRLSAAVPADALLNAARIEVTVANPDGAVSNVVPFTIESDTPTISRINPNSVVAGSGEVTISVTGGGYVRGSSVTANGNGLATSFNSATSLDAVVPADLLLNIQNLPIKVVNPGNKESNEVGLSVTAPTPAITTITPPSTNAGTTVDVAIAIAGSGFIQGSSVTFNGSGIGTTFNSPTSLSAVIPASALTTAGNAAVQVVNPGNLLSNTVQFNVLGAVTVTSVNPATLSAGGASDPVVSVAGTGFVNGSTVLFGGAALPTTFGSATSLSATVPQNLLTTARSVSVSVRNPNGAVSNGVNLTVTPPVPAFSLNVPATITPAGNGTVAVTLSGPAPVALQGTLSMTFLNNSNNAPAGYFDPALAFAGAAAGQLRVVPFTIAQGATTAVIPGNGAFSPGTVAGTINIVMTALTGGGQNLLPSPAPTRDVTVDRVVPVVVAGSVRITNVTGGFQVELNGISSPRDLRSIAYTFTASGTSILEGASVTVDIASLFTTYFASDAGRNAGGTFRFTMPFTVAGGDAAAVTSVSVTMTNSVGTSTAVSGGR